MTNNNFMSNQSWIIRYYYNAVVHAHSSDSSIAAQKTAFDPQGRGRIRNTAEIFLQKRGKLPVQLSGPSRNLNCAASWLRELKRSESEFIGRLITVKIVHPSQLSIPQKGSNPANHQIVSFNMLYPGRLSQQTHNSLIIG